MFFIRTPFITLVCDTESLRWLKEDDVELGDIQKPHFSYGLATNCSFSRWGFDCDALRIRRVCVSLRFVFYKFVSN